VNRYSRILSARFGEKALGLPLACRIGRVAAASPAGGDGDAFATSVQVATPVLTAELRIRDTASAESLTLGQCAELSLVIGAAAGDGLARRVRLAGAVLTGVELDYPQTGAASAVLKFAAQAASGAIDPFTRVRGRACANTNGETRIPKRGASRAANPNDEAPNDESMPKHQ
jgi:hypothetical protein